MNNGKEIPLAHTHNKNFYLENETKKHPLLQFLQKNISNKIEPTEEREKSNRKSSFAKKKSKFIAKPESSSNIKIMIIIIIYKLITIKIIMIFLLQ